jgi:Leucine-rich repeat (LRR) protein
MIAEIPACISKFENLNNLFLHNNPIANLPSNLHNIWDNLQEFSIDWLSYLFPFVGKMITRAQLSESVDTDLDGAPE